VKLVVCSDAFLPANHEGGPPFSTATLCRGLVAAGADVRIVTTNRNGNGRLDVPANHWTQFGDLSVWYANSVSGLYYPAPSASRALQIVAESDCVLGSGTLWTHLGLLAWRAARRHAKPTVLIPRGLIGPWALAYKAYRKRAYWKLVGHRIVESAAAIVALTERERHNLQSFGVSNRLEVIPNGIDDDEFKHPPTRDVLDAWLPQLRERPFVLFLGRLHDGKGLPELLEALSQPQILQHDSVLVVAGPVDDRYRAEWNKRLAACPAASRVLVVGPVSGDRKAALLSHAHAFVLPSLTEALPVSVLEALASGCPVVLTPACNLPEVARAGAGIEVGPDPRQIASACARLLADDALRQAMGVRGRRLAAERFDWRVVGKRMLELCQDVASMRTPR